ncbi:glycosyltransferase family 2 protein [bacterium]|nr:glycosyltransferase family 2 protein [bacterium]
MPKVSVIIPIYNALDDVKLCLDSVVNNFNFELGDVLFINDCSNTDTTEYLGRLVSVHPNIKLLENDENLGFVKTCNKGMTLAKGDIVVLLNSDTKIPAEFCERIIKCFNFDNEIGIASPITSASWLYHISIPKNYTIEKMNKQLRKKHKCSYPIIPSAEGFCFCIRKEVIEQQGYLDEIFDKGYHEEVDYAYRAITNGWKNVLIDDLYVYHKRQASFGAETREKLIKLNNLVFKERWAGFRENYVKENKLKNPIIKIEQEMFPGKKPNSCERTPLEFLFSIKNSNNKKYKIITFAGMQLKIKNEKYLVQKRISNLETKVKKQNKQLNKQSKLISELVEKIGNNTETVIMNEEKESLNE